MARDEEPGTGKPAAGRTRRATGNSDKARLLIAEAHPLVADALHDLLEKHFDVIGMVQDGAAFVSAALRLRPDVAVVDVSVPVMSCFSALRELSARRAVGRVIVLTLHDDLDFAGEAMRAGAYGYLPRDASGADLIDAIDAAVRGEQTFPSLDAAADASRGHTEARLTPRQREVLRLIAHGYRAKDIAATLQLSPRTVEAHKYEMMEALGLDSTAELVRYALRLGIGD